MSKNMLIQQGFPLHTTRFPATVPAARL